MDDNGERWADACRVLGAWRRDVDEYGKNAEFIDGDGNLDG